jgi:hypothetical protein
MVVIIDMVNGDITKIEPRTEAATDDAAHADQPTSHEIPELVPRLEIVPSDELHQPVAPPSPLAEIQQPQAVREELIH